VDTYGAEVDATARASRSVLGLPDTPVTLALREITRSELRAPDLSVTCIDGVLERSIRFASEGPAVCSVTLALAGTGRTRIDGIEPLEMAGGMAVVFCSDGPVAGFDEIDSGAIQAVEIRLPPEHLTGPSAASLRN
jgi:hypothetical protein